jgi:hypothetical protein
MISTRPPRPMGCVVPADLQCNSMILPSPMRTSRPSCTSLSMSAAADALANTSRSSLGPNAQEACVKRLVVFTTRADRGQAQKP